MAKKQSAPEFRESIDIYKKKYAFQFGGEVLERYLQAKGRTDAQAFKDYALASERAEPDGGYCTKIVLWNLEEIPMPTEAEILQCLAESDLNQTNNQYKIDRINDPEMPKNIGSFMEAYFENELEGRPEKITEMHQRRINVKKRHPKPE